MACLLHMSRTPTASRPEGREAALTWFHPRSLDDAPLIGARSAANGCLRGRLLGRGGAWFLVPLSFASPAPRWYSRPSRSRGLQPVPPSAGLTPFSVDACDRYSSSSPLLPGG